MKLTDDTFDEVVLRSSQPTVVLLWKPKCAFCTMLLGIITTVGRAVPLVNFRIMNSNVNPKTVQRYDIHGFPALLLFRDGELVGRKLGAAPLDNVVAWIKENT